MHPQQNDDEKKLKSAPKVVASEFNANANQRKLLLAVLTGKKKLWIAFSVCVKRPCSWIGEKMQQIFIIEIPLKIVSGFSHPIFT
jgi:hypothetical protein